MSIKVGELPRDIDPAAHGLPFKTAEKFLGPDRETGALREIVFTAVSVFGDSGKFSELYQLAEKHSNSAGARLIEDGSFEIDFVKRLAKRMHDRKEAFWDGLRNGAIQAFGKLDGRKLFDWLSPKDWLDGCPEDVVDIHVVDLDGLVITDAVLAFSSHSLSKQIEARQRAGAIYGIPPSNDNAREYYRLFREARKGLAERVAKRELIALGVMPEYLAPDRWTKELPDGLLNNCRLRLPAPPDEALAVAAKRKSATVGHPRMIDWTRPDVAANVWLLEQKNLGERGVRARLIHVISDEVRDWPTPPGETAIGEHANTLIKLHKNLRLSKKSETS